MLCIDDRSLMSDKGVCGGLNDPEALQGLPVKLCADSVECKDVGDVTRTDSTSL